jgi:hypothetical protein
MALPEPGTVTLIGIVYFLEGVTVGLCSSFLRGLVLEGNLRFL